MSLSLIVAMSEDRVIGRNGDLPWRLSADLRRFKRLTADHHVILGRKTYESLPGALPRRTLVVVTRQPNFQVTGGFAVPDLESALQRVAHDDEPFVIGGAEIYRQLLPHAGKLYVTRVQTKVPDGDTFFPELDLKQWDQVGEEQGSPDEKNEFPYSFETFVRKSAAASDAGC